MNKKIEQVARAMHIAQVADLKMEFARSGRMTDIRIPEIARLLRSWDESDALDKNTRLILARAAIAAMREPSEAMLEASKHADHYLDPSAGVTIDQWHAMIDAALK